VFDNRLLRVAEVVLRFGRSGWPVWVHHEHRELHWRVLEIIEPTTKPASPAGTGRYILLVDGPFACLPGREGGQCITATRRDGRWQIKPNITAYPRRGASPGD
jgi:hypothetical protein